MTRASTALGSPSLFPLAATRRNIAAGPNRSLPDIPLRAPQVFLHVVMMQFTETADGEFRRRVLAYTQRVRDELPYVRSYHFGRNVAERGRNYPWAVIGVFDTSADHDRYQVSPVHQEMKAYMTPFIREIVV